VTLSKPASLSENAKAHLAALVGKAMEPYVQHVTGMLNLPEGQFTVTVQRVRE